MSQSSKKIVHEDVTRPLSLVMAQNEEKNMSFDIFSRRSLQYKPQDIISDINISQQPGAGATIPKKYGKPSAKQDTKMYSFASPDRATKRVIAPYVNLVRRGQEVRLRSTADKFTFFLTKRVSVLTKKLIDFLADSKSLSELMYETNEVLRKVIGASGSRLYLVDPSRGEIYQYQKNVSNSRLRVAYRIDEEKNIAAYAASKKEFILCDDILRDNRFPDSINYKDIAQSVLCVPIVTKSNTCHAVMEFFREVGMSTFTKENVKIVLMLAAWMAAAINQNIDGVALHKKQEINDYLLELVKAYFGKKLTLEKMIIELIGYAKSKLQAEKSIFYIMEKYHDELFADVYEEGITVGETVLIKKSVRMRFGKKKNVAALAAQTMSLQNVKDLYNDSRFQRETEGNVINRTELCAPIIGYNGLLGVVSVINKSDGTFFTDLDEGLITDIAVYSAMALHHAIQIEINTNAEHRIANLRKLLVYHMKPCSHDVACYSIPEEMPSNIFSFDYYILPDEVSLMPQLYYMMVGDLIGYEYINVTDIKIFSLMMQKCYRNNPYHNFLHAFMVTHCMWNILKRNEVVFSLIEKQALLTSTLGHDVDHGGFTNNFLVVTKNLLSHLYNTSILEHHHYYMTMLILSDLSVYTNINENNFQEFSDLIKHYILSTDLSLYFKNRATIIPILNEERFNWDIPLHRELGTSIMMTVSDLSGLSKPFSIAKKCSDNLYREFYNQGDIEKNSGMIPLSMMDRDQQYLVPDDQAHFITLIMIPVCDVLRHILPNTAPMFDAAQLLRDTWKQIIETRGVKLWRQTDSIVY